MPCNYLSTPRAWDMDQNVVKECGNFEKQCANIIQDIIYNFKKIAV